MGWRIVLQPDGKLARFSDVVDNFTHINMDVAEATEVCREDLGASDADKKVQAGLDDLEPWKTTKGNGSTRWFDCIDDIVLQHGKEALIEQFKEDGMEALIPDNLDAIEKKMEAE